MSGGFSVEALEDFGQGDQGVVTRWKTELAMSGKGRRGKWLKTVKKIMRRYRDEHGDDESDDDLVERPARFNALWSNVQTLGPAIYSRAPKAVVERRYLDRDPVARTACVLLERPLALQIEASHFHDSVKQARLDYLLAAQGICWVRYEPTYRPAAPELSDLPDAEAPPPEIASEKLCVDYVHWNDFRCSVARTWQEVTWVAKREFLTRDQLIAWLGEELGKKIPLDYTPKGLPDDMQSGDQEAFKKATIWEIWDKSTKQITFISEKYLSAPVKVMDDTLRLEGFWPMPRPLFATMTNDTVVPVTDYTQYRDQALQLDELTARISALTKAVKAAGVYDASQPALKRMLDEGVENQLIPCENWAAFSEKGGLEGGISMLPVRDLAEVLIKLYEARAQVKNDLDEVTGISDIVRGQTDPNETLGAQQLKSNYSTLRLSDRQAEMARFTRDLICIMAEMIAEHFQPETIALMASYEQYARSQAQPQPQEAMQPGVTFEPQIDPARDQFMKAIALLKSEKLRGFRVDIETDSTVEPDAAEEKRSRVEFLTAASQFMQTGVQVSAAQPEVAPLLGKMLLFGVRGFRAGRELESAFEDFIDKLDTAAQNTQPKPPSPEETAAKAEAEKMQMEMQAKQAEVQANLQIKQVEAQMATQAREQEMQMRRAEHDMRMAELAAKLQAQREEIELKRQSMLLDAEMAQAKATLDGQVMQQKAAYDVAEMEAKTKFESEKMELQKSAMRSNPVASTGDLGLSHSAPVDDFMADIRDLTKSLRAKKRVVRDEANRIVGVEVDAG